MSLKNIADEIAISEEDDYGDEGYDDYDDTYDDQSDNAKTTSKKLSQSSPAKMRSSSGKNNTFSMSIEDAAEALRRHPLDRFYPYTTMGGADHTVLVLGCELAPLCCQAPLALPSVDKGRIGAAV